MIPTQSSEEVIIAAAFNIPNWLARHRERMAPTLFQDGSRQAIVAALLSHPLNGDIPDVWAITQKVGLGLAATVTELAMPFRVPTTEAETHLTALRTAFERRELSAAHQRASELLLGAPLFPGPDDPDLSQQVDDIMAGAGKLPGRLLARRHISEILHQVYDEIEDRRKNPGKLAGISTGIQALDKRTAGMMKGHVWVFAGLPGDGKSTIMQNCAEAAALNGHKVDWYPLEMPENEQVFRLLASASQVDNEHLFTGILSRGEQDSIASAHRRLQDTPVHLVDVDGATASDIICNIERSDAEIAVVDYLQLMEEEGSKNQNREQILAGISRRMKRMAKRTGKTILTASQLNDGGKLRESRAIGQDADKVFLINKHPVAKGQEGEFDDAMRLLWCDKNRGLKRHWELPLRFLGNIFQFKEPI